MVVLYVDDDRDDLELFGDAIREVDPLIVFIPASSGEEALDFLHGDILPDFIFLDINMPLMNGIVCLTQIRANPKLKHLPVVMLSTSQSPVDADQSSALEADFISKPNTFRDLVLELSSRLKKEA